MSIRSLSCPVPANINPLQSNGFMFAINKLPDIAFFCQEANIPSLTLPPANLATPFVDTPIPGEKLEFGSLDIVFMIDEDMTNYASVYDWMIGLGFPTNNPQYTDFVNRAKQLFNSLHQSELSAGYSDGVLQILNSANKPIRTVQFTDLYPTNLNTITLQSTTDATNYLAGQATFLYTSFTFT